jgi:hypothetical protein
VTNMAKTDWTALAAQLNALGDGAERGGDALGRQALTEILGKDFVVDAVYHYVDSRPGSELARSVLAVLQPAIGVDLCYEIYRGQSGPERRRAAVELLRVFRDRRVLPWVAEFLHDPDAGIQNWGVGVLDWLAFSEAATAEELEPLVSEAESHPSPSVRNMASMIRNILRDRQD